MALKKLLIMAGGTGGHIFPALAIANQLRAQGVKIEWLGTPYGLENQIIPPTGIPLHLIDVRGLRGNGWKRWFKAPATLFKAYRQARAIIKVVDPDLILGMGGFASGPGAVAAKMLGKPLVIHEQNAAAGLTNRLLAKIANCVLQAFPNTFKLKHHPITTGNPVRPDIAKIPPPSMRFREQDTEALNILILGGSQGALILNQIIPPGLLALSKPVNIWHQTGKHSYAETLGFYQSKNSSAKVEAFIEDMSAALQWADLVICRAGALTVAELATVGVASILIPFPHAVDDHQSRNAEYLTRHEAGIMIPQKKLTSALITETIEDFISVRARLRRMAHQARELSMANALDRVTAICQELGERESTTV